MDQQRKADEAISTFNEEQRKNIWTKFGWLAGRVDDLKFVAQNPMHLDLEYSMEWAEVAQKVAKDITEFVDETIKLIQSK
jgi:hypothetical protein